MRATLRRGSVVRILVRTGLKVGRPGVVLRMYTTPRPHVVVAWGTGTFRPHLRHEAVVPTEPAGVALGIKKPTYFFLHTAWAGAPADVQAQGPVCPPYLFNKLEGLYKPIL